MTTTLAGKAPELADKGVRASSTGITTPLLHENLMRHRRNRDPYLFYEVVTILGKGSMGSVAKVKKRQEVIGGSARRTFLERMQSLDTAVVAKKLARCWESCCKDSEEAKSDNNLLQDTDSINNADSISKTNRSTLSSMVNFGHRDMYYALKSLHLNMARDYTLREELKNEVEVLKALEHPHIIRPLETFEYKDSLYLVMELSSGGDLYTRDPYTESEAAQVVQSIVSAVAYMHQKNISHRDLKYENIMFTSPKPTADCKIIDFGLSKKYGKTSVMEDTVGTIYSMSPEQLGGEYTSKADVWSCGVLAFMLLSSSMPFYGRTRDSITKRIRRGEWKFRNPKWEGVSEYAKCFVSKLLQYEEIERPTAQEVLHHPWLEKMHQNRQINVTDIPETMDIVQASIENFSRYSTLKRLALMVVAHKSSSDEIGFLRRMFKKYDDDKGFVSLDGFKRALVDYEYSDEEIEKIFKGMDIDRTGKAHYFEFLAATIEARGALNEDRLAEAFDRLDSDDSGFITVRNLRDFLGSEVPQSYLDKIIDEIDLGDDHQIDYDEFLQMWDIAGDDRRSRTLQCVQKRRTFDSKSSSFTVAACADEDAISRLSSSETGDDTGDSTFKFHKQLSLRSS